MKSAFSLALVLTLLTAANATTNGASTTGVTTANTTRATTSTFSAQTRGRRVATPQRRRTPTTNRSPSTRDPLAVKTARVRVADQIKNLTRFLYVYGRLSKDFEGSEAQLRGGNSAQAAALSNRTRAGLRDSLQNVREGLDRLEVYFRTTPGLEGHYRRVAGVAAAAAAAEDSAAANQLDAAGRSLIQVVYQLTDVLLEL